MLEQFYIFFALGIHITFYPVKENFQIFLVFEINSTQKKVWIHIFWTKYQYNPWYEHPPKWEFNEKSRFFLTLRTCISMTTGQILKILPIKRIYASRYVDLARFHIAKIKMQCILAEFFASQYRILANSRLAPPYS